MNFDVISLSHLLGVWVSSGNAGEQRHPQGCSGVQTVCITFCISFLSRQRELLLHFVWNSILGFFLSQFIYLLTFTKAWHRTLPLGVEWAGNIQGSAESLESVHSWCLLGSGMQKPERLQVQHKVLCVFVFSRGGWRQPPVCPCDSFPEPTLCPLRSGERKVDTGYRWALSLSPGLPSQPCFVMMDAVEGLIYPSLLPLHPCLG